MARITGNKGEWSELYVLIYLLANGKLNAADGKLNKLRDIFFPVLKVFREDVKGEKVEYRLPDPADKRVITIFLNNEQICEISQSDMEREQKALYWSIVNGAVKAFSIDGIEQVMSDLHCSKIKAVNTDKADIVLQLHDINTGYSPICGFSIKSDLGSAPTLLNAGKTTNFLYQVVGIDERSKQEINNISTKSKIRDRINAIYENGGSLIYNSASSAVFNDNLLMIDSRMPEIIGNVLLYSYSTGVTSCKDVLNAIELSNPLGYARNGMYKYKFKKLLCAIALGMMPGTEWDGYDEANGGYIIVTTSGDVVAYHIYNRNSFEDYLLDNTKFERASTSRYEFATLYNKDDSMYINLNLQIRFK